MPAEKSADAARLFAKYELFSLMDKFELNINDAHAPEPEKVNRSIIKKASNSAAKHIFTAPFRKMKSPIFILQTAMKSRLFIRLTRGMPNL